MYPDDTVQGCCIAVMTLVVHGYKYCCLFPVLHFSDLEQTKMSDIKHESESTTSTLSTLSYQVIIDYLILNLPTLPKFMLDSTCQHNGYRCLGNAQAYLGIQVVYFESCVITLQTHGYQLTAKNGG